MKAAVVVSMLMAVAPAIADWRLQLFESKNYQVPFGPHVTEEDGKTWRGWKGDGDSGCRTLAWTDWDRAMSFKFNDGSDGWFEFGDCEIRLYTEPRCKKTKDQKEAPVRSEGSWNVPALTKSASGSNHFRSTARDGAWQSDRT
jgi:hypothetical protein